MFDTIIALATAPMKSAIAVIRLSGEDCFTIVSKSCSKDITNTTERKIVFANIMDGDDILDEVVMNLYVAPKSFTGENTVEIMCHGSMLIVKQIIEKLIGNGARMATRGEFTSRAYLHNKIDLIQAEAVNDVINATTSEAKKLSMMSLKGETSSLLDPIKKDIADLLALVEVNIDFPEYEDIEKINVKKIINSVSVIHEKIQKLINEGKQGQIIKEGIKVAIVGKPNVGKSSLLNALLNEDKAIVTSIAGTTRDVVEGDVNLKGVTLHLLDTAGIHESTDEIENIGISKSREALEEAELVLLVLDASKPLDFEDQEILEYTRKMNRIIVYNKTDLVTKLDRVQGYVYISAEQHDINSLTEEIIKLFGITDEAYGRPSLNNARQIGLLSSCDNSLLKAKADAEIGLSIDLISVSLQSAYHLLCNVLGDANEDDLQKEIFSRFCVGK